MRAFPDACGWGAEATVGTSPTIIHVTNTNNSGMGSLRTVIQEYDVPRVAVFDIAGKINLETRLRFKNNNIYIAGQTAPGDGITLLSNYDGATPLMQFEDDVSDVIVRYLKIRPGIPPSAGERDAITFRGASNIILDHLTLEWATDEVVGINPSSGFTVSDVTIQFCIIAMCLRPHSTGTALVEDGADTVRRVTFYRNLFAHNAHRNPLINTAKQIEFINNVDYNWKSRAGRPIGQFTGDFIGNYLKDGPWSTASNQWEINEDAGPAGTPPYLYVADNAVETPNTIDMPIDPDTDRNMWRIKATQTLLPDNYFSATKLADGATYPVPLTDGLTAYTDVLRDVGDNAQLDSEGNWVDKQDAIDATLISQVQNGTGPATDEENNNPSDYGGYPIINAGVAYIDTDGDGMPDDWEMAKELDPNDPSDGSIVGSNGYSNVELFLNGPTGGPIMSVITDLQAIEAALRAEATAINAQADAVAQSILDLQAVDDVLDAAADVIEED